MAKQIKIDIPNGYELDLENSTAKHIQFKPALKPKFGDILAQEASSAAVTFVYIYNGVSPSKDNSKNSVIEYLALISIRDNMEIGHVNFNKGKPDIGIGCIEEVTIRLATEKEKRLLFNELSKQGVMWDEKNLKFKNNSVVADLCKIPKYTHVGNYLKGHIVYNEEAEALVASFSELLILRNETWKLDNNWKPNWKSTETKYTIEVDKGHLILSYRCQLQKFLAFSNEGLRDKFAKVYKELILSCSDIL